MATFYNIEIINTTRQNNSITLAIISLGEVIIGFVLLSNAVHPKRELNHIFEYRKQIAQLLLKV